MDIFPNFFTFSQLWCPFVGTFCVESMVSIRYPRFFWIQHLLIFSLSINNDIFYFLNLRWWVQKLFFLTVTWLTRIIKLKPLIQHKKCLQPGIKVEEKNWGKYPSMAMSTILPCPHNLFKRSRNESDGRRQLRWQHSLSDKNKQRGNKLGLFPDSFVQGCLNIV